MKEKELKEKIYYLNHLIRRAKYADKFILAESYEVQKSMLEKELEELNKTPC